MNRNKAIIMLLISTLACGCSSNDTKNDNAAKETVPALDLANMDTTIRPGDDFFRYANNNWLKNNPIPEEYTTYGAFVELDNKSNDQIDLIIKEVSSDNTAKEGSVAQKIRDFYNAGMDTVAIEERGYSELLPYFDLIGGIGSKFVSAINNRDYTLIMGVTIFYAALIIFMNLVCDILYQVVDPRIKIG